MAILASTGFYGFVCSMVKKASGYVEHFLTGFAGYGWKIWEYTTGKYKLEIDSITVRGTMTVFELLIQKIRAVKGALAITQGSGKIESIRETTLYYEITIEDEMSFVSGDYVRCQTFSNGVHGYHVQISVSGNKIIIPKAQFDRDEGGNVIDPPRVGDELVQFGNLVDKSRQSAIYLHADENGQPAIDVMFGIKSKDWSGCTKIRLGGELPGTGGMRGFYCENGMIKSVSDDGSTIYQLAPDGSFNLGRGKVKYDPDTDKLTFGSGVTLTWDNLSEDAQDNLKGEPGKDGIDGMNGQDGLSITWKGDLSSPPNNPEVNWCYRNTSDGMVYIFNGTSWSLMVTDGNDGTDGTNGADGLSVFITYHDSADEPSRPGGDGTTGGWHTDAGSSVVWMAQKVAESASSGTWGAPIKIKGENGKDGTDADVPGWVKDWDGTATEIDGNKVITPRLFAGSVDSQGKITGVSMGNVFTGENGEALSGIYAYGKDKLTFKVDASTGHVMVGGSIAEVFNTLRFSDDPQMNQYLNFEAGFNWAVTMDGGSDRMIIHLPQGRAYNGVRCNIINVGFINSQGEQDGGAIEIYAQFRSNRKLRVEGSTNVEITNMILELNGVLTMYAVPNPQNNDSVIWYVMNIADFYVTNKSQNAFGKWGVTLKSGGYLDIEDRS